MDESVVVIKGGRHPLQVFLTSCLCLIISAQELTVEKFIPNDTLITEDKCIAMITGMNFEKIRLTLSFRVQWRWKERVSETGACYGV